MHQLIASYLFQNKACPLPGIGTLSVATGKAELDFLNTAITAPPATIIFESKETDASIFLDYIAVKTKNTVFEAIDKLGQFCNSLKAAAITNTTATLEDVGNFFTDASGNIHFKPIALPAAFLQSVKAQRVIHPQAEHTILVGDKETTNTLMTEYYTETPVQKNRWWVWAIVLGIIGLLAILIYYTTTTLTSMAGNAMPIQ